MVGQPQTWQAAAWFAGQAARPSRRLGGAAGRKHELPCGNGSALPTAPKALEMGEVYEGLEAHRGDPDPLSSSCIPSSRFYRCSLRHLHIAIYVYVCHKAVVHGAISLPFEHH